MSASIFVNQYRRWINFFSKVGKCFPCRVNENMAVSSEKKRRLSSHEKPDVNLSRSGSFDTGYGGFGWRHFQWRKISQGRRHFRWRKISPGRRHFQWRKISQGRRHKDYLDKSDNWFNKEPGDKLSPNFIKMPKVLFLLKIKTNTYSVAEQKDKNRHGPSKQFGPKLQ